jgi:CRISPR-associated protein Cas5t
MQALCLYVDVPLCAFRPHWSREYQDTYPFPPPATVFGMLLSLGGVDWPEKSRYAGVELVLALQGEPQQSRVFRKFRRVPQSKAKGKPEPDPLTSRRPDYQDLLLGLKFWVWLRDGKSPHSLADRVLAALNPTRRHAIRRYGGLSLGESSHLVNEISLKTPESQGRFLSRDPNGYYQLPVWVHHPRCGEGQSRMGRFSLLPLETLAEPPASDPRWITIVGPQG